MKSPENNPIKISKMATKGVAVDGRTPPDVLGGPRKKGIGKGVRKALITVTALTALGGVGYAAYENIPAVHRTISGLGSDETTVPQTFDNKVNKGIIGLNNTKTITDEEIQQLPSFDKKNNPILLFPIINLSENTQIEYEQRLTENVLPPNTVTKAQEEKTRNEFFLPVVPAGSSFITSESGKLLIMAIVRNGQTIEIGARLDFMSPDKTLWTLSFATEGSGGTIKKTMNFLIDAPVVILGEEGDWPEGKPIEKGTNISEIIADNPMSLLLMGITADGKRIPGDIKFSTDPSQQKLLVANK